MTIICFGIIKLITLKNTEKLTQYKQTVATDSHLILWRIIWTSSVSRPVRTVECELFYLLDRACLKRDKKRLRYLDQCGNFPFVTTTNRLHHFARVRLPALTLKFEILVFLPSISMITEAPLSFSLKL